MADKQISQLIAAETVNDDDLLVLEQGQVAKKLTGKKLGDYVYAAAAEKIDEVNEAVAEAQIAVAGLIEDKDEIVSVIVSMASLGTDTTLTQTGMAADSKTVGDKMTLLAGNITGVLSSRTATTNIPKGKLVIFNYNLYKTTAAIASGELLTPGTNCIATTLAAELEAIETSIENLTASTIAYSKETSYPDGSIGGAVKAVEEKVSDEALGDTTVGTADGLLADTGEVDQVPYLFRKTFGNSSRLTDKIVGGTIAWNQLQDDGNFAVGTRWQYGTVSNNKMTVTSSAGSAEYAYNLTASKAVEGHKYLSAIKVKAVSGFSGGTSLIMFRYGATSSAYNASLVVNTSEAIADNTLFDSWFVFAANSSMASAAGYMYYGTYNSVSATTVEFSRIMLFDLTQMFGSAVADQIYAMEQATAGAGVAYFKSLFPKPYYAYNAGELMSVKTSAHVTRGFNQWDEEAEGGAINAIDGEPIIPTGTVLRIRTKNFIPCLPSTTYYGGFVGVYQNASWYSLYFYDKDKKYLAGTNVSPNKNTTFVTPANAYYMKFNTSDGWGSVVYNGGICINISDPAKNGTYEPYESHTYPLDSSLTLRGIPKLDSNNNLYYDGDIYEADGTVTRKYGIVDLGTLDFVMGTSSGTGLHYFDNHWIADKKKFPPSIPANIICDKFVATPNNSYGSAYGQMYSLDTYVTFYADYPSAEAFKTAMSGVYLVYELETPTTETADPFTNPQICSPYGTEEYVDERTVAVPVGHDTFYHTDLKGRIEGLPDDFSTLIAPKEVGFTATRAYTAKQFLIINNQLYKVTANIANGATITVGTNVTATTIGEILATLI